MKTRNRVQSKTANKETKLFNCRNQIPSVLIARILLQMSVTHTASVFRISEPSLRTRLWPQWGHVGLVEEEPRAVADGGGRGGAGGVPLDPGPARGQDTRVTQHSEVRHPGHWPRHARLREVWPRREAGAWPRLAQWHRDGEDESCGQERGQRLRGQVWRGGGVTHPLPPASLLPRGPGAGAGKELRQHSQHQHQLRVAAAFHSSTVHLEDSQGRPAGGEATRHAQVSHPVTSPTFSSSWKNHQCYVFSAETAHYHASLVVFDEVSKLNFPSDLMSRVSRLVNCQPIVARSAPLSPDIVSHFFPPLPTLGQAKTNRRPIYQNDSNFYS